MERRIPTSSACSTEIGGHAVYLKPGQVFKANTSLLNFRVLGLSIPGTIQGVAGNLLVKNGSRTVYYHLIGGSPATVACQPSERARPTERGPARARARWARDLSGMHRI